MDQAINPKNQKWIITLIVLFLSIRIGHAQEFIPLWPEGKIPNSKGIKLEDSLANERIHRVGTPGMYAYFPSKEENKGSAVLICPGGGYARLAHDISGHQLAKWYNTMGVTAFVLYYRLPNSPDLIEKEKGPLQDAQRAIRLIRANASKWNILPNKVGAMGTSAGGHLVATLGTHLEDVSVIGDAVDSNAFSPDFMMLVSPVITMGVYTHKGSKEHLLGKNTNAEMVERYSAELQVTKDTPPTFIVHAYNDTGVKPENSLMFFEALLEHAVSASFHVFPFGGHSIALRNNPGSTNLWTTIAEQWLEEMGFLGHLKKQ